MKVTFKNGTTVTIEVTHVFSRAVQSAIDEYYATKKNIEDTVSYLGVACCKNAINASERRENLIKWFQIELDALEADIKELRRYPIKTIATITGTGDYAGKTIEAFASISSEDAMLCLHNRKKGHEMAVKNLLKKIAEEKVLGRDERHQLAARLLPQYVDYETV